MEYAKGTKFWEAQMESGYDTADTVKTVSVTIHKITPLYYFIEPSELLFGCSTRLRKNGWDKIPIVYHTTEKEALYALLNRKDEKAKKALDDIVTIRQAIAQVGKQAYPPT